jgi:hypothetical protein
MQTQQRNWWPKREDSELPPRPGITKATIGNRTGPEGYWILKSDTERRLRKEVRAEQWAHNDEWRKWATLVFAILGFTLGFWSLIVKSKQTDPCPRNYYRTDSGACVFALSPQGAAVTRSDKSADAYGSALEAGFLHSINDSLCVTNSVSYCGDVFRTARWNRC